MYLFLILISIIWAATKKIGRKILLVLIGFFLLLFITLQFAPVQNFLVKKVTRKLSKELGTEVSIKHVSFSLFDRLNMEGTLIRDKQKDTALYAGALKFRITDWFFLKDQPVIKYIGLEDAVVKMQRRDSVWNYQFLVDHFASSSKEKKEGGLDIDLKKIDLKNIRFLKSDLWRGEIIKGKLSSLVLNADTINFNKNKFSISDLTINQPYFSIQSIDGLRPISKTPKPIDTSAPHINAMGAFVHVKKINIINGIMNIESDEDKPTVQFDGAHIYITKLNANFTNVQMNKDTLRADIDISAKERSGIEIKKLKAKYRLTPHIMEFAKMDLQTNKSRLGDYYAMRYRDDFNRDFDDFVKDVFLDAKFINAKVNSDDIAYFAPELKDWKKEVILSGNFEGSVANFNVKNLFAKAGSTTYISGSLAMKGLPYIDNTIINFNNGTIKTNYNDVAIFAPIVKEEKNLNLPALQDVLFKGNFNGTITNFATSGSMSTSLGALNANVSMQIPKKKDATYSGALTLTEFNIGKFMNNAEVGLVNFDGKIAGTNFSLEKIKTTIEGNINSIEFNNYTYTNIKTNGTFQKKYFNGELNIDDPNLEFKSQVEIDLNKEEPSFNILGELNKSNLKALQFYKKDISLTGLLDVNFTGTNIDNFLGTAKFLNANINGDDIQLGFDSLNIISRYSDSIKYLHLGSNDFNASIVGEFNIQELPNNIQSFLHHYYPSYIDAPKTLPKNQTFTVTINTNYVDPYLQLFEDKLSGLNDMTISGTVNTKKDSFALSLKLPYAKYKNYIINGADINGIGNSKTLKLTGDIDNFQISDSLNFPKIKLSIAAANDHSFVSFKTNGNSTVNEADLNADVNTLSDGVRILFNHSSFILNEKKWNLEKEGEISIRKNLVEAKNVKFSQGFQEISVESDKDDTDSKNNLIVKMKNVILGDITSALMKDPKMEGVTTGDIHLHNFFGKFNAAADLKTEQFRLNDDSIGVLNIKSNFLASTGIIKYNVISPNSEYNFTGDGFYNLNDSVGLPLNANIKLNYSKINIAQQFLTDIFTNVNGYATGNLTIAGDPNAPDLTGRIHLKNAGLKVNYTQVYYGIDSADIKFEDDGIDFGEITIHDTLKNKAIVKGKLFEKGFKQMKFDFDLSTNKLLLIDTKPKDNQQFYGRAIGKAIMSFKGPDTKCIMTIVGESNDSSHIFIPNSFSRESGDADFIVFKKYGTEMASAKSNSNFNLLVDLDLKATKATQIDVILDPLSGDVIKATGDGRLRIRAGTTEPLNIRGRYDIDNGSYDFNFQSFIRKPFILKSDAGNYIEWTGDPNNANIHIAAQYAADNVSVSDLISNQQVQVDHNSTRTYRGEVYVIANLTGKLSKPDIKFLLDFPQGSPIKTDQVFAEFINKIEKDDNEMLKQVTYLITFNSFVPYGSGGGANNINVTSLGYNTISQIVTKELNKAVSGLLYRLFKDKSLHIDLNTSVYSSSSLGLAGLSTTTTNNTLDRTNFNFKVGKSFFKDKLIVTFGGNFDFNVGQSASTIQNGNFQWLPDLTVEYFITKDKTLRAIVFNKNSLDYSATSGAFGRRNRQGIGLSYKKDFEKLFAKKEDEIKVKPVEQDSTDNKKGN